APANVALSRFDFRNFAPFREAPVKSACFRSQAEKSTPSRASAAKPHFRKLPPARPPFGNSVSAKEQLVRTEVLNETPFRTHFDKTSCIACVPSHRLSDRSAASRSVCLKRALARLAPGRRVFMKRQPSRIDSDKSAPVRSQSEKSTPLRSRPRRS